MYSAVHQLDPFEGRYLRYLRDDSAPVATGALLQSEASNIIGNLPNNLEGDMLTDELDSRAEGGNEHDY